MIKGNIESNTDDGFRSNDQRQNISRDAKTRFSHTAMQQHSRSSSFFQIFPFISTFEVISIILTINHDQIVAALEFSVPNVPSLISEDLGAPLFLGGYKVTTSSDHSFHQNHTYIAFYATLFHNKILWNPVSCLKTSSKSEYKKTQTPPIVILKGSCESFLATEVKGKFLRFL